MTANDGRGYKFHQYRVCSFFCFSVVAWLPLLDWGLFYFLQYVLECWMIDQLHGIAIPEPKYWLVAVAPFTRIKHRPAVRTGPLFHIWPPPESGQRNVHHHWEKVPTRRRLSRNRYNFYCLQLPEAGNRVSHCFPFSTIPFFWKGHRYYCEINRPIRPITSPVTWTAGDVEGR